MAKEQTPLDRVAQEMSEHCEMSSDEISAGLKSLLESARDAAASSLLPGSNSPDERTLSLAQQYWALAELINQFGSALCAFHDMEETGVGGLPN